jgi:two-component system chemotaxis response regulator CheY
MKSILLIEDDAGLCFLLERILQQSYSVFVMNDGLEACAWLFDGNACDLVIADVNLPSVTGIELLENLSSSGLFNHIPVIMLASSEESKKLCLDLGAVASLVKPFNPSEFLSQVKQATDLKTKSHA